MDSYLVEVVPENLGSALQADAAAGDDTLVVDWSPEYSEDGATILLNGQIIDVETAVYADDNESVTLTFETGQTLDDPAVISDFVQILNPNGTLAQTYTALVTLQGSDAPVEALIPLGLMDQFAPDDSQAGAIVNVEDDGSGGYIVTDRPTDVPVDPIAVIKPTDTFTVTVAGDLSGLTAVAHGDLAQVNLLNWYIDGVLAETSNSMVMRFDALAYDLLADTPYAITVAAVNDLGEGPLSPPATGTLNPGVASETVLGWVAAGFLLAGTIQVGQMTIRPATADDPGGITIPLTSGGVINFPADGSDAVITAILRARSLVVEDNLRVLGDTNAILGGLQLANGTTAPTVKPRAGQSWDHADASTDTGTATVLGTLRGLYDNGTTWIAADSYFSGIILSIDKTTGVWSVIADSSTSSHLSGHQPFGGITKVGSFWYLLVYRNSDATWWVQKYNTSWVWQSEWQFTAADLGGTDPAIASDGTSLFIARMADPTSGSLPRVIIRQFTTAGVAAGSTLNVTGITGVTKAPITGYYVGAADFGATKHALATTTSPVMVINTLGVRQPSFEWPRANGHVLDGLAWDGTRFHHLSRATGKVWHYAQIPQAVARSITYTWFDDDGTTHETEASPALAYTQATRQWMRVDTDPPSYAGDPDDPNAIRIYIANQRQTDPGTGITTAVYDVPATGGSAAPTSNGFVGVSAPGNLTSAAADGAGPYTEIDGAGKARIAKLIQSDTVNSSTVTNPTVVPVTVTFDVPFDTTPRVEVTADTTRPDLWRVSKSGVTATGFTLYFFRETGSGNINADWTATTGI